MTVNQSIKLMVAIQILILFFLCQPVSAANTYSEIHRILAADQPPKGIAFELVEGSEADMEWALAMVRELSTQLRQRYKDLPIVLVSHGQEMFALSKENKGQHKSSHDLAKQLATKENVPVQVCGTHAAWEGYSEKDFPGYVTVVEQAPAQLSFYEGRGYTVIELARQ